MPLTPPDILKFLEANASAIFGLLGALGAGLLSYVATSLQKRRDFNLQMWGKLFDRRISAHEKIIAVAVEMRVMVGLEGVDAQGEVRRAPRVLISKEEFERWFTRFTQLTVEGTTWLTTQTKRELNFTQDYLVALHLNLAGAPTEKYLEVGELIRQDFIDLSSSLEKKTFEYFEDGIHKLRLDSLDKHHKYKLPETMRRLDLTLLIQKNKQIKAICQQGAQ
jgi:hypothetical protein